MENLLGKPVVREISPENCSHIKPENVLAPCNCSFIIL